MTDYLPPCSIPGSDPITGRRCILLDGHGGDACRVDRPLVGSDEWDDPWWKDYAAARPEDPWVRMQAEHKGQERRDVSAPDYSPGDDECPSCHGAGYVETNRGPVDCDCIHEDAHGYSRSDLLFGGNWS